jgi:hypothetical protein
MKEAGFDVSADTPESELYNKFSEGLNLNTQEGWFKAIQRAIQYFGQEQLKPITQKLSEREKQEMVSKWTGEAKKLAEDVYKLPYGEKGKDENNVNTAIGKMNAYLDKYPEDAKLGHVKILRLAMADEGFKIGEKKGVEKEQARHDKLRRSAMEDDAQVTKEGTPQSDWSVSEIMSWRRKHGK